MSHRRTWKRRARGACVGLGLCLLWAGPSAAERARVAILPVVVDTELAYEHPGIDVDQADHLILCLQRNGHQRVNLLLADAHLL